MLNPKEFIEDATRKIKEEIGDEKTIIALSELTVLSVQFSPKKLLVTI